MKLKTFRFLASRNRTLVLAVWVCGTVLRGTAFAQDQPPAAPAIQVKTDEILVPVLVLNKKGIDAIHQMDRHNYFNEVNAPNSHLLMDLAVTGLSAGDFRIFEDGKEQEIERVTPQPGWKMSLPTGRAYEFPGVPLGNADSAAKVPYNFVELPHWPTYQISYAPPPSPSGSCHTVNVKVGHRDSYVFARSEYCNTTHAVYDNLNGTPFGNRMAADLNAKDRGTIRLMAAAFSLFHADATAYTQIVLNTPMQFRPLEDCTKLPEIGFLGMIYSSDGKLSARFSGRALGGDLYDSHHGFPVLVPTPYPDRVPCVLSGTNRFEARLDLPPGEYQLRAVIRDEKNFGRTEIPLHVESFTGTQLAIGNIALGKNHRTVTAGTQPDPAASPDQSLSLISKGAEILPTADTRFKARDALDFFFEIFSPPQPVSAAGKIEVHMRILDATTGQVAKEVRPVDAATYSEPGDPIIHVGGGIDVSNLPIGNYQLQAQAADSTGRSTAWSSVAFSIQ